MKRALSIVLILTLLFGVTAPAFCDTPLKKLGRGVCNIITSPLELFEQSKRVNNTDGPFAGMTYGVLKGLVMIVIRAGVGVYEMFTFPIPAPPDYKPILTDPEYMLEDVEA
ncbi:MAG: exosortase system-associated protein, TIGR04073 family, partial [Candidatus Omnitrophica bacterium]|nr:exosortase system-associated protein, TIGR04073 family [Candidatus Omnitrophota bacterium]